MFIYILYYIYIYKCIFSAVLYSTFKVKEYITVVRLRYLIRSLLSQRSTYVPTSSFRPFRTKIWSQIKTRAGSCVTDKWILHWVSSVLPCGLTEPHSFQLSITAITYNEVICTLKILQYLVYWKEWFLLDKTKTMIMQNV